MALQASTDEQQWIEILKSICGEQISSLKEDIQKLKEEAKRKKTQHLQDYIRLRKGRNIDLQESQTMVNTKFEQKEHELDHFQDTAKEYFSAVLSQELSRSIATKFDRIIDSNRDYREFYNQMLGLVIKKKKKFLEIGKMAIVSRKDVQYLEERMSEFILRKKEKVKGDLQAELNISSQDICEKYHDSQERIRNQCGAIRSQYKQERRERLKKTASILVENLMSISPAERKMPEFESKIYRALFDAEAVQLSDPNAKFAATNAEFDAAQDSKVRETLEQMVYNKTIDEQHAIRALCLIRANYREPKEEARQEEQTRQSYDPARRLEILVNIIGEESIARRILEANPALASVGTNLFETYISALKDTKRAIHSAGRERRLNLHPEQFASLESLQNVKDSVSQEDELETIYSVLDNRSLDPEVIDAVLLAFKPLTKKFSGDNYIPLEYVWNNARPHIPQRKWCQVDKCLKMLVNKGVVITHGKSGQNTYSLNPRINEDTVPDEALRRLAQYRQPKNGS